MFFHQVHLEALGHASYLVGDDATGQALVLDPRRDVGVYLDAARAFCHTVQTKILPLPDHVEVWPTHVAGSLCGGNIGSRLSTTIGYERRTNAILAEVDSKGEFVRECIRLDNLPAVPPYWRRMRAQNLDGVALLGDLPEPPALHPTDFEEAARAADAVILDARQPEAFGGAGRTTRARPRARRASTGGMGLRATSRAPRSSPARSCPHGSARSPTARWRWSVAAATAPRSRRASSPAAANPTSSTSSAA
ncbi:MAG: hypothetical protein WD080_05215 [Egibacteraceae bacterium]